MDALKDIFKTATLRQSATTFFGTVSTGILGLLFYIIVARQLGPADFGLLTFSIAVLTLIADIADLGINTGIVRFIPNHLASDKEQAYRFIKLSIKLKLLVWIVVLILGYLLAPFIAVYIFSKDELMMPLRLVMVGVGGALLFSLATATLQAFQRFGTWSLLNISTNLFRLLLILFLISLNLLNLSNSLITYIGLPFFGFILSSFLLPTRNILKVKNEMSALKTLLGYSSQVSVFALVAAVSSRMDTFLVTRLLSAQDLGFYGAANQLNQVLPQLVGALGVVVAPKFASYTNPGEMLNYFKKLQFMTLALALLILVFLPVAIYFIPLILGDSYNPSIPVFVILLISNLVFLISIPAHNCIFYYFSNPRLFIWIALGHLLIILGVGYFMISNYGIFGAALTVFIGMIFNLLVPLGWIFYRIKSK